MDHMVGKMKSLPDSPCHRITEAEGTSGDHSCQQTLVLRTQSNTAEFAQGLVQSGFEQL